MSGLMAGRPAGEERDKGRVEVARVGRYWAGKRPEWVDEEADEGIFAPKAQANAAAATKESARHTGAYREVLAWSRGSRVLDTAQPTPHASVVFSMHDAHVCLIRVEHSALTPLFLAACVP